VSKLPAIQFYPADWRKDLGVQSLSFHDRGIWFEILMLMHESEVRGKLLLGGRAMTDEMLATVLRIDLTELRCTLDVLVTRGVTEREKRTGALINRRMIRDEIERAKNRQKIRGWRKAKKLKEECNHNVTPPVTAMLPLSSSSSSITTTKTTTKTTTPLTRRGSRIPADFTVTEAHRNFAREGSFIDPDLVIDEFRDYWSAVPGSRGVKLDWDATFRNRIREKTKPHGGANGNGTFKGKSGQSLDAARRVIQEIEDSRSPGNSRSAPASEAGRRGLQSLRLGP
jgi:hypothetical protein